MYYSSAGFFALLILLIINNDVLRSDPARKILPAHRSYRAFLISVSCYYVTDILWGVLYERHLIRLTFIDTVFYFTAMAFSILFWTQYVVRYLKEYNVFGRLLAGVGGFLFVFQAVLLGMNFFRPVLFSFDEAGGYHALTGRYATLAIQIVMFLMTGVYAYAVAARNTGTMKLRHRTIGLSSVAMAVFIGAQAVYPLLPMYALGCMLSTCVLHAFVLENEKEEYRDRLEAQLRDSILKCNSYDLLTGLPGMSYFFEQVQRRRTAEGSGGAFLYINLSGLKFYNKDRGFSEGDKLLRALAQLLTSIFGTDNCSRLGQDHFAVFTRQEGLSEALDRLFSEWGRQAGRPAILVGVCPDQGEDADISTVCDMAKIACDAIQSTHTSSVRYYDAAMFISAERAQYITSHLDRAIAEKWIQVYYQPIVRGLNGRVCDEEALARWIDPVRGFLSPADFIPALEASNLIYKLDLYMVEQVLEKLKTQRDAGLYLVPQSINLSRSDFDMCDIVEELRRRVDDAGFSREMITVEITESIIGTDFDFMKAQVDRLRGLGFRVWMDDFGSGYSSLDVLQSMQVDLIKFDMRFMQKFTHEEKSKVILTELMKMAIGLGIDTVCEGVERADQVQFLQEIGCSKLQGYYYAKPMPLEKILERYETGRADRL